MTTATERSVPLREDEFCRSLVIATPATDRGKDSAAGLAANALVVRPLRPPAPRQTKNTPDRTARPRRVARATTKPSVRCRFWLLARRRLPVGPLARTQAHNRI